MASKTVALGHLDLAKGIVIGVPDSAHHLGDERSDGPGVAGLAADGELPVRVGQVVESAQVST